MTELIQPVILCGGSGTRLWPVSRAKLPKQFQRLTSEDTMLQETVARVGDAARYAPPIVICGEDHRFIVAGQLQEIAHEPTAILLEPEGRNTAPAIAAAALVAAETAPEALLLVLPADHHVARPPRFEDAIMRAAPAARDGRLVTFGIAPTGPETGFGYIRAGAALAGGEAGAGGAGADVDAESVRAVARFVEKPDPDSAARFLDEGGYFWNAGVFLFRADVYLAELERARPDILAACRAAAAKLARDGAFLRLDREAFLACPAESIDYAVMEKTARAAVAPVRESGWSDVGSWNALRDASGCDAQGNAVLGDVILEDVRDCYVRADGRLVAAVGVSDLVIVDSGDALLVARCDRAQEVKAVVTRLAAENRPEIDVHPRVYRPWGFYETIHLGERHQVKHIQVKPGASLSLQMHHHRAEHWVVVSGTAIVTRGDEETLLSENQSIYIPLGHKHRLVNPGKLPLSIIEVQTGSYLGEDDIVRFEDVYRRV